jgi:hypothetical protein
MPKSDKEIVKREDAENPNWLAELANEQDDSMAGTDGYVSVPRVKIVQSMTKEELKDLYGEGTVVILPGDAVLSKKSRDGSDGFEFTPVFFWVEFQVWSDRSDTTSPMIRDRSFSETSEIAIRSRDPKTRIEPYGPPHPNKAGELLYKLRYIEALNFIIVLQSGEYKGMSVGISFQRGEFATGKRLISLARMRVVNGKRVPLWAGRYFACSQLRERGDKKWYGLSIKNADSPFISQIEMPVMKGAFEGFRDLHAAQLIGLAEDNDEGGEFEDSAAEKPF